LRPSSPGLPAGCWTRACPSRSRSSRRGETRGVACNTDEAGRSKNRRVEVWLTAR
jgi:flagellar motor protein MotB